MSRAACNAMVASLACSEPQCLWARPLRLRMKTSHSGVFGVDMLISLNDLGRLLGFALPALLRIGRGGFAHPGAVGMGLAPRRHAIAVAWTVAGQHLLELVPVDRTVDPMPLGILRHSRVGNAET